MFLPTRWPLQGSLRKIFSLFSHKYIWGKKREGALNPQDRSRRLSRCWTAGNVARFHVVVFLSIWLVVFLSIWLVVFLSIWLVVFLSIWLVVFLSVWLVVFLSIWLVVFLSIWLVVFLSIWLVVFLSIWLFVFLSIWLFVLQENRAEFMSSRFLFPGRFKFPFRCPLWTLTVAIHSRWSRERLNQYPNYSRDAQTAPSTVRTWGVSC